MIVSYTFLKTILFNICKHIAATIIYLNSLVDSEFHFINIKSAKSGKHVNHNFAVRRSENQINGISHSPTGIHIVALKNYSPNASIPVHLDKLAKACE